MGQIVGMVVSFFELIPMMVRPKLDSFESLPLKSDYELRQFRIAFIVDGKLYEGTPLRYFHRFKGFNQELLGIRFFFEELRITSELRIQGFVLCDEFRNEISRQIGTSGRMEAGDILKPSFKILFERK